MAGKGKKPVSKTIISNFNALMPKFLINNFVEIFQHFKVYFKKALALKNFVDFVNLYISTT